MPPLPVWEQASPNAGSRLSTDLPRYRVRIRESGKAKRFHISANARLESAT
jgi:hypothetical protein